MSAAFADRHRWNAAAAPGASIAAVVEHVAWEFGLDPAAILGGRSTRWLQLARCAVVWLARRRVAATHAAIAAHLGCHPQTSVWWLARARRLVAASADTRTLFDRIDATLGAL